jgi:hypothetical protein
MGENETGCQKVIKTLADVMVVRPSTSSRETHRIRGLGPAEAIGRPGHLFNRWAVLANNPWDGGFGRLVRHADHPETLLTTLQACVMGQCRRCGLEPNFVVE